MRNQKQSRQHLAPTPFSPIEDSTPQTFKISPDKEDETESSVQDFLNLKPEHQQVIKSVKSVSKEKKSGSKDELTITTSHEI